MRRMFFAILLLPTAVQSEGVAEAATQTCESGMTWDGVSQTCIVAESVTPAQSEPPTGYSCGGTAHREVTS